MTTTELNQAHSQEVLEAIIKTWWHAALPDDLYGDRGDVEEWPGLDEFFQGYEESLSKVAVFWGFSLGELLQPAFEFSFSNWNWDEMVALALFTANHELAPQTFLRAILDDSKLAELAAGFVPNVHGEWSGGPEATAFKVIETARERLRTAR